MECDGDVQETCRVVVMFPQTGGGSSCIIAWRNGVARRVNKRLQ